MKSRFVTQGALLLTVALLGTASASRTLAQPPGGFGGGPPGGFGGGGRGGPRELTAAGAPVDAYASAIKLNDKQKGQIKAIQDGIKAEREKMMPKPGTPPDFNAMRPMFEKMRAMNEKADKDIDAILTAPQKKALAPILKQLGSLRNAGFPLEVVPSLKLTDKQIAQIGEIVSKGQSMAPGMGAPPPGGGGPPGGFGGPPPGGGRPGGGMMGGMGGFGAMRQMREKLHAEAVKVLTPAQKKTLDDYEKAHPRPQFGGFGGGRGR